MVNNSKDLIIYDDDYIDAANYIKSYCDALNKTIECYISCLNEVSKSAIKDNNIKTALASISNEIFPLHEIINNISDNTLLNVKDFVKSIDDADDFLY